MCTAAVFGVHCAFAVLKLCNRVCNAHFFQYLMLLQLAVWLVSCLWSCGSMAVVGVDVDDDVDFIKWEINIKFN